jgi:hypothetical protein
MCLRRSQAKRTRSQVKVLRILSVIRIIQQRRINPRKTLREKVLPQVEKVEEKLEIVLNSCFHY